MTKTRKSAGFKKIAPALAAATCSLIGTSPAQAVADNDGWEYDTAVLFYSEGDGRVSLFEPVFAARKGFGNDHYLNLKVVFDTLTGATPNGALASNTAQTFTRPSGKGEFTTKAGQTPLDDTFKDTRTAVTASWEAPLSDYLKGVFGVAYSNEYDYTSSGVNALLSWDLNKRNTTLTAGVALSMDDVSPVGGVPIAFASMVPSKTPRPRMGSSETKDITDLVFGISQVIDANTVVQLNYSLSSSDGYHTDPYKIISRLDAGTGDPVDYVYENRPDSRTKHAIYGQLKRFLGRDIVDASYRYLTDDWGIQSHTFDIRYSWRFTPQQYLQPHLRYYIQEEADFYTESLVSGKPLPKEASADYRLANFSGLTFGLEYGGTTERGNEWSVAAEMYNQAGDSSNFPDLTAVMLRVNYNFDW